MLVMSVFQRENLSRKDTNMRTKRIAVIRSVTVIILLMTAALIETGCAGHSFGRPPGERIASCEGKLRLESGRTASFRLEAYRNGESDFRLFFSMPAYGVRNRPVEDIAFDGGILQIETSHPHRVYTGSIAGDRMKLSGSWNGFAGEFTFDLDD